MTQEFNRAPAETSPTNEFIGSALTGIMLVLFSVVSVMSVISFVHV